MSIIYTGITIYVEKINVESSDQKQQLKRIIDYKICRRKHEKFAWPIPKQRFLRYKPIKKTDNTKWQIGLVQNVKNLLEKNTSLKLKGYINENRRVRKYKFYPSMKAIVTKTKT